MGQISYKATTCWEFVIDDGTNVLRRWDWKSFRDLPPLSYVDDKTLLYLAEVLKVQLQELFPTRPPGNRIYDFIEKLETTRF